MTCLKPMFTTSFETGAEYISSVVGAEDGPIGANAPVLAWAWTGWASEKAPLTRRPGAVGLASETDRVASPAVEITVAVVPATYSLPTPGVNGPNVAAGPIASDSVAGTVPPTGVSTFGHE